MAVKIEIEAVTTGFRRARNEMDGLGKSVKGLGDGIKAMLGLELAEYFVSAAQAAREFALAGADASRVAAGFRGNLTELRAASGNAIDDTTLQRMDTMARKTGLASSEIASLTRLATKFSRESGQEMAATFQQLIDASPEQLEKWGILTSDLTEELKGLDTVAQKAVLRQALIAEGAAITNEEIEAQTHAVESLTTRWDNLVSTTQAWVATVLDSDGARDATTYLEEGLTGAGEAFVDTAKAVAWLSEGLTGLNVLLDDSDIVFTTLRETAKSLVGPVVQLGAAYKELKELANGGEVAGAIVPLADAESARQWGELRDKYKGIVELQETATTGAVEYSRMLSSLSSHLPSWLGGEGNGWESESEKAVRNVRRIRDETKALVDLQRSLADFGGSVSSQFQVSLRDETRNQELLQQREAMALWESTKSSILDLVESIPGEGTWDQGMLSRLLMGPEPETTLEMMARFTGELDALGASWSSLTAGMGDGTGQVRGVIDALSTLTAASPELEEAQAKLGKGFDKTTQAIGTYASTGIGALSAFTGAFVEDQKIQAGLMSAFEAAMALASWPDPVGVATHAAASVLFGAVAAGAFDGGGGGAGRGGAQAGAAFGAPTLADAFDGGGNGDTKETTVIQLQVDGRALGEASLRGANDVSSTFRRGETLQADAVGAGRKGLF